MSLLLLQEVALSEHEARSYGAAAFKKGYHAYFSGCERTSRRGHGGAMILAKASLKSASAWAVKDRGGAAGKRCVGDLSIPCAGLPEENPFPHTLTGLGGQLFHPNCPTRWNSERCIDYYLPTCNCCRLVPSRGRLPTIR